MTHIPQMIPLFGPEEALAVDTYMKSGGFLTEYIHTTELERRIAEYVGSKHAIMVSNGTVSLYMMLKILGIGPGSDVIVPNYTMIATANSVTMCGANPIFIDVEKETLCLDINLLDQVLTKSTKAIFLVTANGRFPSYDIDVLKQYCLDRDIYLLEDAAQSMGCNYASGRHIGTVGVMGSFSFSVPKIITTGQGGCIVTDNDEFASKLRRLKDFGRSKGGLDVHDSIGFNFKFTDLQAVIGIEQIKKLSQRINIKNKIWDRYRNNLEDCEEIKLFKHDQKSGAPWFIDSIVQARSELRIYLETQGIQTRVMYPPINQQVAYSRSGSFPVSEYVGESGLWLPSYVQLENSDIDFICEQIRNFYLER